jgi:hypothetical protein
MILSCRKDMFLVDWFAHNMQDNIKKEYPEIADQDNFLW